MPYETFAAMGEALGLSEDAVLEALVRAIRRAGPGVGGRYVAPHHRIGDDEISRAALDELLEEALSASSARPRVDRPARRMIPPGPFFS